MTAHIGNGNVFGKIEKMLTIRLNNAEAARLREVIRGDNVLAGIAQQLEGTRPDTYACEVCGTISDMPEKGRTQRFCKPACKQRAYRERLVAATRPQLGPSIESEPKRPSTKRKAKRPKDDLRYWRKGRGVIHIGVRPLTAFCGRPTEDMTEQDGPEGAKLCQRCQNTRDNKTWWRGYREAFGV